jgi:hypothetical protein
MGTTAYQGPDPDAEHERHHALIAAAEVERRGMEPGSYAAAVALRSTNNRLDALLRTHLHTCHPDVPTGMLLPLNVLERVHRSIHG